MVPLSFVMLTVRIVDFILRLDFYRYIESCSNKKKRTVWVWSSMLLCFIISYLLVSTFDTYFPELHLEGRFRLPLVVGYLYLLLFVLGAVNQFKEKIIEQDLAMKQANYPYDLKRGEY